MKVRKKCWTTTPAAFKQHDYASLSKDQLVGDLQIAAAITQMELLNRQADGQLLMQPGFGLVNTVLEADYRHGVPREVRFAGLGVDIDGAVISAINTADTADTAEGRIQLVQQMGTQLSALEHRILEVLFTDENNPGEAASTVKALSTAAAQGQTLYTLDASNSHYLNQITATEAIETDIRNAINAGLVATIHEAPVSIGGWVGTGYSLIDPQTGAGAYRIWGGENGGFGSLDSLAQTAGVVASASLMLLSIGVSFVATIATVSNAGTATAIFMVASASVLLAGLSLIMLGISTGNTELCEKGASLVLAGIFLVLGALFKPPRPETAAIATAAWAVVSAFSDLSGVCRQ